MSQMLIEEYMKAGNHPELFDSPCLAGVSAHVVRKARDKLRFQNFDCSSEELEEVIERNGLFCSLMIADQVGDDARIDTVSLSIGIPSKAQSFFEAIGSGSDLANTILTDICTPGMTTELASVVAVHAVEVVKRHDPYCGGPTKLALLRKPYLITAPMVGPGGIATMPPGTVTLPQEYFPPVLVPEQDANDIVQIVLEVDAATKAERSRIIREALEKRAGRHMREKMVGYGYPKDYNENLYD